MSRFRTIGAKAPANDQSCSTPVSFAKRSEPWGDRNYACQAGGDACQARCQNCISKDLAFDSEYPLERSRELPRLQLFRFGFWFGFRFSSVPLVPHERGPSAG